ncbi:glutamate--cysteine ligase, partial [Actinomadura sp. BRA 177]|nr:glutamate--cysteine ligase [Actinomadura sp. BRA 177]
AGLAALGRARVGVSSRAVDAGEPAPDPPQEMLRAAYWLAARDGLGGRGVDVCTGRPAGFRELAGDLLAHALPALGDAGDAAFVTRGVRRLLAGGTGAERQRAAYRRRGRLADVVDAALLPGG